MFCLVGESRPYRQTHEGAMSTTTALRSQAFIVSKYRNTKIKLMISINLFIIFLCIRHLPDDE